MKSYTLKRWEEGDECTNTSFKSGLWLDSFPRGPLFIYFSFLASSFLMSVFILRVTVWNWAPSDRSLYTPLHIMEPTPSVLNFSCSSLSQTVAESMSVQFVKHLKWRAPAFNISLSGRVVCSCVLSSTLFLILILPSFFRSTCGCIFFTQALRNKVRQWWVLSVSPAGI